MKNVQLITDAQAWDGALLALPAPHILQSWVWGTLKEEQGWQTVRVLWMEHGRPVAAAQVLILQRGRLRLGYVPKGPILDWANGPLSASVLSHLAAMAHRHRMLLLKCDPNVRSDTAQGKAVLRLLAKKGWRASFEQIQFRNTMVMDLRESLDGLMAQAKAKWRYNVRLATRKNVVVRDVRLDELPLLYDMYLETAQRNNFIIREQRYYLDVWERLLREDLAFSLLAENRGDPLAMVIILHFGKLAWYVYGASYSLRRNLMPNHLLQWEAIRRLKELGCTSYDLWGAPDTLDESDPLWGVHRFKRGMGASFEPHIGAYDYAPHQWLYRAYALLRPSVIALAQWRYWAQTDSRIEDGEMAERPQY